MIGALAPVMELVFLRLCAFLSDFVVESVSLGIVTVTEADGAMEVESHSDWEAVISSKEDTEGLLLSEKCFVGSDTDALRTSTHDAVDNFRVWPLLSPSKVCCCANPHDRRNRSETSAIARLISEEELPESSWPEFFLDRTSRVFSVFSIFSTLSIFSADTAGSGAASHGQMSSDVEAPGMIAMLGFFTLDWISASAALTGSSQGHTPHTAGSGSLSKRT